MTQLTQANPTGTAMPLMGGSGPDPFADHPHKPVRRLLTSAFRGRYLLLATSLVGGVLAAGYAVFQPNVFESSAKFRYRPGSESVSLKPAPEASLLSSNHHIAGIAPILLTSEELLRRVVRREIGETTVQDLLLRPWSPPPVVRAEDDGVLKRTSGGIRQGVLNLQSSIHAMAPRDETEEAAMAVLGKGLRVGNVINGGLLETRFAAHDPDTCQAVLRAYTEEAQVFHMDIYRDKAAIEIVTRNFEATKAKLGQARQAIADFEQKQGTTAFAEDFAALKTDARAARKRHETLSEECDAFDYRLQEYSTERDKVGQTLVRTREIPNARIAVLERLIKNLEYERAAKAATVRPGDPALQRLDRTLRTHKADLAKERDKPLVATQETVPNPDHDRLTELISETRIARKMAASKLVTAKVRSEVLGRQLAKMAVLNQTYARLEKARDDAAAQYQLAQAEHDRLQHKEALRDRNFSALKLVIPASIAVKTGPERTKMVFLGLLAGLALGGGILTLRSMTDTTIRTPEELEALLGIRVLAAVPQLDKKNIRRHEKKITSGC